MRKKAAAFLCCACALAFAASGCASGPKSLKDDFAKYISENYYNGNDDLRAEVWTASNTKMIAVDLQIENSDNPDVVLFVEIEGNFEEARRWTNLPAKEKKADLRKWGNIVAQYIKNGHWKGDYHVYVRLAMAGGYEAVYDYAGDLLRISNDKERYAFNEKIRDLRMNYFVKY